jgi:uncharacterized membrane protein YqjE
VESEPSPAGFLSQAKMLFTTGLSSLHNRGELFLLELEEEKTRFIELLIWAMAVGVLGLMFLGATTVFIVLLFPEDARVWAVAGFCVLYLGGAIFALLNLKSHLKTAPPPFSASVNEMKKDREWLESSQ